MAIVAWEMTHSVETNASPSLAWNYWTNVANWDDPPAKFAMEGPFAAGTRGATQLPGQDPLHWIIRKATPPDAATIEIELPGATLSFEWRFDAIADGRTRLTQRVVLAGENAEAYRSQAQSTLTATLPAGMAKIADAMARASSINQVSTS
jgi:hypothetical protein